MTTAAVQLERLEQPRARSTGFWGMMLLIATEASLFAYLLFSYFYLGSMANTPRCSSASSWTILGIWKSIRLVRTAT